MKPKRQPPGPKPAIFGRHARQLVNNPLHLLEQCSAEYGNFVALRLLGRRFFILNHPDYIKHVLVTNQGNYQKGRALEVTKDIIGQGLLTSEGAFHQQQRRLMQPAFHRSQVAAYAQTMVRLTGDHTAYWQHGQSLNLHQQIMQLTMKIVAQTLFGADISRQNKELVHALDNLMNDFGFFDVTPLGRLAGKLPTRRNRQRREWLRALDSAIYEFIGQGQSDGLQNDTLLSMLLAAHLSEETELSLGQIRDEVMTLFIAGHETTANAIVWTFYLLAQHPSVEARLHTEVDELLQGQPPTAEDARRLKYTRMVLSEAMRLYPPAWAIGRLAINDDEIGGYHIPANSTVLLSQWIMHRHPAYWDAPLTFNPDRFDPDEQLPHNRRPRYAYFPFGGGPRACIGESFAWMEGILLIAMLAQQFRFEMASNAVVDPQPGITLRPRHGLPVVVKLRPYAGLAARQQNVRQRAHLPDSLQSFSCS